MPLKVEIKREVPKLESLNAKDQQRFELFLNRMFDNLEEISRRAQEAGVLAEQLQEQQQILVNNLASPSVTNNQDPILGQIGNLSADLTAKIVGVIPVGGKIAIKDSVGNSINILTE
jgi:hypothetical protein